MPESAQSHMNREHLIEVMRLAMAMDEEDSEDEAFAEIFLSASTRASHLRVPVASLVLARQKYMLSAWAESSASFTAGRSVRRASRA